MDKVTTTMYDDEFIDTYKPEQTPEGEYYRQRHWEVAEDLKVIQQAQAENRLWTALYEEGEDGEDCWQLLNGWHYVNILYFVICEVPYTTGESLRVIDEADAELEVL